MTDKEKQQLSDNAFNAAVTTATGEKPVYGGTYDKMLADTYDQIANREDFSYNVNADPLYETFKNKYTTNAKRSMKDTMGQAASLTGGYSSTYSQGAGQQAYDETMRGLTDKIPELYDMALNLYKEKGDQLESQFNMLGQLQSTEYNQWRDQLSDYNYENETAYNRQQTAYSNLTNLIMKSGYQPSAEEMTAAGMSQAQANALRQAWMTGDPSAAWMAGAISADDYYKLTGQYPPGYTPPAVDTGAYYGGSGGKKKNNTKTNPGNTMPRAGQPSYSVPNNDGSITLYDAYGNVVGYSPAPNKKKTTNSGNKYRNNMNNGNVRVPK